MFVVGLTGGIGSGKSVVGKCFGALGINVVDADQASRKVVEPGSPALAAIARHFGEDILLEDGNMNRAAMRETIFKDPKEKDWLEKLLHPLINQWTRQQLELSTSPYAILESPLLLEMGQSTMVDRVLVVDVPEEIQIQRATARDSNSEEQIKSIIAAQISRDKRLARADDIIDNSGPQPELPHQVATLHQKYLELAAKCG